MPRKASTDSTTEAQNRFVVSLPAENGPILDRIAARVSAELKESTGVAFDLSRAQVVQSLIRQADESANGDEPNDESAEPDAA